MPDLNGANGQREDFRVVGKPNIPGLTSYAMATGTARYGADYVVPGMLYAKFLRSPYAHARMVSVDDTQAKKIPGVAGIVRWDDSAFADINLMTSFPPKPCYLGNEAHHEGAEVGLIVVASSESVCEEALAALKIEWEELPHIVDIDEGRDPGLPAIRGHEWDEQYPYMAFPNEDGNIIMNTHYPDDPRKQGNVGWTNKVEGDLEAGWKQADMTIEYDVNLHDVVSLIPNPQASVAWWEPGVYRAGKILRIEGAVGKRSNISALYSQPDENVVQEGMFNGGKYCDWGLRMAQEITPMLSKKFGRPVRCCNTREENFDLNVNARRTHVRMGVTAEGLITAVEDTSLIDHGVPGSSEMTVFDRDWAGYYTLKCENLAQRFTVVDSNRGYMHTCGQFTPYSWDMLTVGLHVIAEKLGKDVVEIARLNLHGPDSQTDTRPVPSFEACVEKGRALMNWQWHPAGTKRLPDGRLHGASFRYQMCPRHTFIKYFCKLEYRGGRVHFPTAGPIGGWYGTECFTMIIAEELGIDYSDVVVDYDYKAQHTDEAGGSDGVTGQGWIVKECANKLKKKLLEACARQAQLPFVRNQFMDVPNNSPFKGYAAEDLDLRDGKVVLKSDPSVCIPFSEATLETVTADYSGPSPKSKWKKGFGRQLDTMNTSWCEVAVDEETGEVEILKYAVVPDVGKVIRRTSLESQIDQCVFFSQGAQLMEEYVLDPATGVKLNGNMIDYRKPTALDVPVVEKDILELRSGDGCYGASGIAHCLANSHLIILAIHNATGVWVDPPATPDRVLKALGKC